MKLVAVLAGQVILERLSLFKLGQVLAHHVLDDHHLLGIVVIHLPEHYRHGNVFGKEAFSNKLIQSRKPALSNDQFVSVAAAIVTHYQRFDDPVGED